ncbi:MAG: response regulator [Alphaproteobacteria bacterium]|nr:response regulator [Alphaproteobacteria bacterium]
MPYTLDKVRILIVDDMTPMLDITKAILKTFGFYHVFTATNGEEAFELACNKEPDLIITDWIMEPMDGLEFAKKIRTHKRSPDPFVPIIMMTGFSSKLRVEEARDSGITEFLVKPFTSEDLYKRVHQIIEKPRQFVEVGDFFGPDRRRRENDNFDGPAKRATDKAKDDRSDPYTDNFRDILRTLKKNAKEV